MARGAGRKDKQPAADGGDRPPSRPVQPSPANREQVRVLLEQYQTRLFSRAPSLGLIAVSMVLLTLSFEPIGWSWLAWVALVPWLIAIATSVRWGWMLFCSWLGGTLFFAGNLYWLYAAGRGGSMGDFLLMGGAQLALSGYLGLYFLLFAYVVGGMVRRWGGSTEAGPGRPSGLLMTWLVPVGWVGTELLRGYVMSGFPWFLLGHSQVERDTLRQIASVGGAYGISFLVAAVNGLIADGMLQPLFLGTRKGPRPNYQVSAATLGLLGLMMLVMAFGRYRIHQYSPQPGPYVAGTSANIAVNLGGTDHREPYAVYGDLCRQALDRLPRPDLVLTPETMIGDYHVNAEFLDAKWKNYLSAAQELADSSRAIDGELRDLARQHDTAILIGAISMVPDPPDWPERNLPDGARLEGEPTGEASYLRPQIHRYNSAILYQPGADGKVSKQRYDKHHLVPFGELIPFRTSWPWAFRLLRKTTPQALLEAGRDPRPLTLTTREGKTCRLAVTICYEDVVPQATRRLVWQDGRKQADFLVNISNDGWFLGTAEVVQHMVSARFRCVETGCPMVRSVNGGCSCLIDSLGRVGSVVRPGVEGIAAGQLMLDRRTTIYCRIGDAPWWCCVGLLLIGAVMVVLRRHRLVKK
ncbi:MAG: Apolipoprotein N-acyltransferase [Phycisphaerae bacterium]|nr:Apolipoprotein N-acyltransferase [Phycisphaerae bacterium]